MPAGLKRFYGANHLHYLTCSCYRRRPLLGTPRRRNAFLKILEQVRQKYDFTVVGYVVMPEHFHLLISEPAEADPSVVMKVLKQRVARRLLRASDWTIGKPSFGTHPLRHGIFGRSVSMTSTSGAAAKRSRSCATCTAIR